MGIGTSIRAISSVGWAEDPRRWSPWKKPQAVAPSHHALGLPTLPNHTQVTHWLGACIETQSAEPRQRDPALTLRANPTVREASHRRPAHAYVFGMSDQATRV